MLISTLLMAFQIGQGPRYNTNSPFSPAALSDRIKHLLPFKLCTDRGSSFNLFSHEHCTAL